MPTLSSGLTLIIPNLGDENWEASLRTNCFQAISEHDHTGSGRGVQIATAAIAADAVTDAKILLANESYLRGRNQANLNDIDILKVDSADKIQLGNGVNPLTLYGAVTIPTDQNTSYNPNVSPVTALGMTFTRDTLNHASYWQIGKLVFMDVFIDGTTSGAPANVINIDLPVAPNVISGQQPIMCAAISDGAAVELAWGILDSSLSMITILKADKSNFGLGASRLVWVTGCYRAL